MQTIRNAKVSDAAAIAEIYNHYVLGSAVTFETEAVTPDGMAARIRAISQHHPYLVHEEDDRVTGYCYAHAWKERAAYRHTLETTVYVAATERGKGVGERLMRELIRRCRTAECHALVACITGGNEASEALHRKLGFLKVSHFGQVGRKFGRWLDVVDYELLLP